MNGSELIGILKNKFKVQSDIDLAKISGISIGTINNWKNGSAELTPRQIGNLVEKATKRESIKCIINSIKPIIEYYSIDHTESKQGKKWEIIKSDDGRGKKIKDDLRSSHGIYIFYNSQCEAIYVGKAKRLDLWTEMNNTFNRDRDKESQHVWTVYHPEKGQNYTPAHEKLRQLKKTKVFLYDIASYFSAYDVNQNLIDNLESLLIRGFANDLNNVRMEKFKFKLI